MKPVVLAWLFFLTIFAPTFAQDVAKEKPIELPTYEVVDTRALPPPEKWSYGRIAGFEVLSNASPKATKRLVNDFQRFSLALGLVWPGVQRPSAVPASLIICGSGGKFDAFVPKGETHPDRAMASLTLRSPEVSSIVVDYQTKVLNLVTPEGLAAAASAPTSDSDGNAIGGAGDPGFAVDAYRQLYREYIHFLVDGINPRPAAWLEEGLAQIFMAMEITDRSITVGKLEDPNEISATQAALNDSGVGGTAPQEDRDFNAALAHRALLPMAEMFAVANDSDTARQALGGTWAKQCYAFVHWGLYGDQSRHQQAFITFLQRLEKEQVSEALFKECFKKSYKDMELTIRGYVEFTSHKIAGVAAPKGQKLPEPPPFELRDATESEIGRIKGDALRLAGHEDAAHLALIAPYIRGERDPQLLAAIGLQERAAGDLPRARKFLEAAARANAVRPRAYLELARLQFADAAAHSGPGGRFSAAQTADILKSLFTARGQPPRQPEVYEAIAEAWGRCEVTPTAAHLGVLDEGVRLFPRDVTLIQSTAELKVKSGLINEASALIDLGLRVAPVGAAREKFETLKASLPKPPAGVAPAK
jgi:hypothetical protein